MDCPTCGESLSGPFCRSCGAPAPVVTCPSCGQSGELTNEVCSECATPLVVSTAVQSTREPVARRTGVAGWAVSGALLVALALAMALPQIQSPSSLNAAAAQLTQRGGPNDGPGSAANVDLSTMTPREAADRLFLRVMRAAASNDDVELQSFLPMALGAYALVDGLDSQGSFRVALLQRIGGLEREAFATLTAGLSENPSHLLLLGSAMEVAVSLGEEQDARQYATRLVDDFDAERDRALPEYEENVAVLENLKLRADELLTSD